MVSASQLRSKVPSCKHDGRRRVEDIMQKFLDSVNAFLGLAAEKGRRVKESNNNDLEAKEDSLGPTKSSFLFSNGHYKVKSMIAEPIASLLSIGELVSCSKHALRGLIAAGARVPCKTAVLELFDLMFGCDGDWLVTGDLRVEANLYDHLRSRDAARGKKLSGFGLRSSTVTASTSSNCLLTCLP